MIPHITAEEMQVGFFLWGLREQDNIPAPVPTGRNLSMREIMQEHSSACKIGVKELRGQSRLRDIAWARQGFMLKPHKAGFSYTRIGNYLDRDHTTIVHGVKRAREREATPQ